MGIDYTPIFEAVRQASTLCIQVQETHVIASEKKQKKEPVTIADYGSQAIIGRTLSQYFPNDSVISEESGAQFMELISPEQRQTIIQLISDILVISVTEAQVTRWLDFGTDRESERIWVIDPIDGTKGFLRQQHYVVAVGIMEKRQVVGGIIGAPAYPGGGRLFYGLDGEAYAESLDMPHERQPERQRIHVTDKRDLATFRALESVEKSHVGHARLERARQFMGLDEALVERADSMEKYVRVAAGDAEVYMRLPRIESTRPHSIWDHAAGVALIEAAGGKATDIDGSPLDFSTGIILNNYGILATNGTRHAEAVAAVQKLLEEEAVGN